MVLDSKKILKKYVFYGFVVSIFSMLLNFVIRPNFFPYVKFENSIMYYLIYIVIATIISIIYGFLYELLKSKISNKYLYYIVLTLII